jgi:hypothetical protein
MPRLSTKKVAASATLAGIANVEDNGLAQAKIRCWVLNVSASGQTNLNKSAL